MLETLNTVISSKNFPPVLLMFGEEEFLLEESYEKLLKALYDSGISDFNIDFLDGETLTPDALVDMAMAYPMMSDRRAVIVKHFEKLTAGRASKNAAEKSPFTKYFSKPPETTVLVLKANLPELNGIAALLKNPKQHDKGEKKMRSAKFPYNLLLQNCVWIEFPKVYERDLPSWIAQRLKVLKREIEPEAAELLIAQAGTSLRDINNELEKLLIFVGDKKKILLEDVNNVVGASRIYNIFELQKTVGQRDLQTALNITRHMLIAEKQELLIISMLSRYFTILWRLAEERTVSQNHFQLANAVGISPYFVPEYIAALDKFRPQELERAFFALRDADFKIKSSAEDSEVILQKMLMTIIEK
jgi:DNA polymerase-3 subunit delta